MRVRALLTGGILSSLLVLGGGCVAAAAGAAVGAGTYAYVEGDSQATYPLAFEELWRESLGMLETQGVAVTSAEKSAGEGTIKGELAGGKDVTVKVKTEGPGVTQVSIRVGVVPDKSAAERLQSALAQRVGVDLPF